MKKYLIFLITSIVLIGCGGDKQNALENVKELFPKSKIYKAKNNNFRFYIIDSFSVKQVNCLNFTNDEISSIIILNEVK